MKLKSKKLHYYEGKVRYVDSVYFADKLHGEMCVRRGICEEVKTEKKERKPRRKKVEK